MAGGRAAGPLGIEGCWPLDGVPMLAAWAPEEMLIGVLACVGSDGGGGAGIGGGN